MRELIGAIDRWRGRGESVALATVIATWGSAPRGVGSKMAVSAGGEIAGSVSGGCVEAAVVEAALGALKEGRPRLLRFGVTDDTAWEVGLSCGGTLEVFVEGLDEESYASLRSAVTRGHAAASATVLAGPTEAVGRKRRVVQGRVSGSLGAEPTDAAADGALESALAQGRGHRLELPASGGALDVFVDVIPSPPTLIMVGGVHIATALATLARALGYVTIVVDPRPAFGSEERFPDVDRLLQAWPDDALAEVGLQPSSAVAVLTHDPKLDDPALQAALPSPAFYVGALGSKATQARRRERLMKAGLTEEQISRLHAPIGLDLGGRSPEEIALAVMAEVVATRNRPLRGGS